MITHGTSSMEETARYLAAQKIKKTIVLTGSTIPGSFLNTDADFNLGYALGALQFLEPDVYVAMNGKISHWRNVIKKFTDQ